MKAIFIDSDNQKLIPIELDKQKDLLEQYYSIIGNNCKCIDAPYQFNDNEILLVDDEGLFNTAKRGFKYPDWNYPVVGNGIITGVNNDTGDFVSLTSDIEKFNNIIWCDEKEINIIENNLKELTFENFNKHHYQHQNNYESKNRITNTSLWDSNQSSILN
jgi:hypothetical protein